MASAARYNNGTTQQHGAGADVENHARREIVFRTTFTLGKAFDKLAQIPGRAAQIFRERLGSEISPELQSYVLAIMAETPGEPSSPFEFATLKSSRFYFWLITSSVFSAASDGAHWIRSGEIENSWQVEVSYGALNATIRVFSNNPAAKFVYGPNPNDQVAGHKHTGWGEQFIRAQKLVLSQAKRATFVVWRESVKQAAKEVMK